MCVCQSYMEETLSSKGFPIREKEPNIVFAEGDVKKFISDLKEEIENPKIGMSYSEIIDKLAGDKLK